MSNIEFKYIPVTTMTLVVTLSSVIERVVAFCLLPITRIDLPKQKRRSKKYKLPFHDKPGCILSMRYNGITRGIIRSNKNSYLKNSISIDISVKDKNINVKLSKSKIHMCGAKSTEQGRETAQYIVDLLVNVQNELNYMNEDENRKKNTFEWIKDNLKGSDVKRPVYYYKQYVYAKEDRIDIKKRKKNTELGDKIVDVGISTKKGDEESFNRGHMKLSELLLLEEKENVEMTKQDDEIILIEKIFLKNLDDNEIKYPDMIPDNVDERIVRFMCNQIDDYDYYSDLIQELNWLIDQKQIYQGDPKITNIQKAMVNYNYDLGYDIDRGKLTELINMNKLNGFSAIYDNMAGHNVTISTTYETEDEDICRKKESRLIKFIVYHSGKVTQSGPNEELNELAYNKFINTLDTIRNDIIRIKQRQIVM